MPETNVMIEMDTLGDGLYTEQQMNDFKRFLASGGNSRQLLSDFGQSSMNGQKPSFNIFTLMNIDALRDMQFNIADRIFGFFSKVDRWIYPVLTCYSIYAMVVMLIKVVLAEVRIFQEDGFALRKMLAALIDPIFYLLWLPTSLAFGRRAEQHDASAPKDDLEANKLYPDV